MQYPPKRGFDTKEYESRVKRLQKAMYGNEIDLVLLTAQVDIEYYSGFQTQFFQSPTRPWYLLVPLDGKPKAIIPTIGKSGMKDTWIDDILTWSSPNPKDEGISLLISNIKNLCTKFKTLGVPMGHEYYLRMALKDYSKLLEGIKDIEVKDVTNILRRNRYIKSHAEIEKIDYICKIVSQGFTDFAQFLKIGESERANCKKFKSHLLSLGVDDISYMISGSGQGGYGSIIMGPSEKILQKGDIFVVDTGCVYDGYFCDFDRNFALDFASDESKRAYEVIFKATEAGFEMCRVGNTTSDIFHAMNKILQDNGALGNSVGRLGHGLGMQLTEWPSITPNDNTILKENVVLTLEPSMEYLPGKEMAHEENVLVTKEGPMWLTKRASRELLII